jgi:hypothetical protein
MTEINNEIQNIDNLDNLGNLDNILNSMVYESLRTNILNIFNGRERNTRNPNRIPLSQLRTSLSSRYYNTPPQGGYHINEEHEYNLDYDDLHALVFLDMTTRFASPITDIENKNLRKSKIKQIKYHKVKEEHQNECPICLDNINVGEYEKTLDCKHCFHKKCIDRWFNKDNDFCPMCRLKVIN